MLTWHQFFANYLLREELSDDVAARQLGVSARTVQAWRMGESKPRSHVQRIASWSRGEVPASTANAQQALSAVSKPGLLLGCGDRNDDCQSYEECLWDFSEKTDSDGHCPVGCGWYRQVPREYHVTAASLRRTE